MTHSRPNRFYLPLTSFSVCVACACSVQKSQLLTREAADASQAGAGGFGGGFGGGSSSVDPRLIVAGTGPVTPAVVEAINERPIGGASLTSGTTGGGNYEEALAQGQLFYVDTVEGIREAIGKTTPAILLIAEGTYRFSVEATDASSVLVCDQACEPSTPLAKQTILAASCTNGETTYEITDNHEFLRVRSNKTLIGLGNGATLKNAMISLSNVTNVILRNLAIEDVGGKVNGLGYGVNLWPGDHIWVDHCTFRNIGRSYFNIMSTLDDTNHQTVTETGYITLTHNYFDGTVASVCEQRSRSILGTSQVAALTLAYNWLDHASRYNGQLFGPDSWAHAFNNYWSDINGQGLGTVCGATAVAQGNVFESTTAALFTSDSGVGTYTFCKAGLFGNVYAPMSSGTDEDNLLDGTSTLALNGQTTDGTGLTKPARSSGHTFEITAPTKSGTSTEAYEITLIADPKTVTEAVKAEAGAGKLF